MSKYHKITFMLFGIIVSLILWFSTSLNSKSTIKNASEFWPKEASNNGMDFIPKEYGRLVDVKYYYPDRRHNIAELWFEDDTGTIRIIQVDKGKSPDFEPLIDNRVRIIPRR